MRKERDFDLPIGKGFAISSINNSKMERIISYCCKIESSSGLLQCNNRVFLRVESGVRDVIMQEKSGIAELQKKIAGLEKTVQNQQRVMQMHLECHEQENEELKKIIECFKEAVKCILGSGFQI